MALILQLIRNKSIDDAKFLLVSLASTRSPVREKALVIQQLNRWEVMIPTWFQIAEYTPELERLYEDEKFPERLLAALVVSKVYYCLSDYQEALKYALAAKDLFNLTPKSCSEEIGPQDEAYINRMIEEALDSYKKMKKRGDLTIDERLEALINRIFDKNVQHREYRYAVGLGLDTRRLDRIEEAIKASGDASLISETVAKVLDSVDERTYRNLVLDLLLRLFSELPQPDFVSMCQSLVKLDRPESVADIMNRLIVTSDGELLACQIAFDLYETASQQFINKVVRALYQDSSTSSDSAQSPPEEKSAGPSATESTTEATESTEMDTEETSGVPTTTASTTDVTSTTESFESPPESSDTIKNLARILSGEETIKHQMQFLIKNNHTDMLVLKNVKESVRNSTLHNSTVIANGFMHAGTTCDDFLRDNLDWISKAINWNKFNAVASLGLIHTGHEAEAMKLLEPYLPKGEAESFGYKEGGSLYALGLIHANHGNKKVIKYLGDELRKANSSALRHGGCLGLGLAAMGTHDQEVYYQLRETLYTDDAITGEAAGLAMGLVMIGSLHTEAYNDMIAYATETQHDKIQRGLRLGISLLVYGRMEEANPWISQLLAAKSDPTLRQTGVLSLATAYCGSGNANVVRRLLSRVAADPNQDVKRFAATAIGFILIKDPSECLNYTSMLVEHFNGYVRYGAAMALGVACAGTGNKEALSMIEPMLTAKENYVRQGALLASAFILIQHTEATCSKVKEFRATLTKTISDKTEDLMSKFGAVLAQGILDAGGRNVTLNLQSRIGDADMSSVVGVLGFLQYWYWHSMSHFLALAFRPTCLIGLNKDLKMPKVEFRSNAKASMFAYPPALEEKKEKESEKVETAVLSITAKAKRKEKQKGKTEAEGTEPMDQTTSEPAQIERSSTTGSVDTPMEVESTTKTEEQPEPYFQILQNPTRVMKQQLKYLTMPEESRYKPLKPLSQGGIIMLKNLSVKEPEELVATVEAGGLKKSIESDEEAEIPQEFEITLGDY